MAQQDNVKYNMTERQQECLGVITKYIEANKVAPSLRDIMEGMEAKSVSETHRLLHGLKERGHIDWIPGKTRSITVL